MRTRLLALALVPLTGTLLVAAPTLGSRRAVVTSAAATADDVARFNAVVELEYALIREQIPTEALIRAARLGISESTLSSLIDFDVDESVNAGRAAADEALSRAIVAVGGRSLAPLQASIKTLRAAVDDGSIDVDAAHAGFAEVATVMSGVSAEVLGRITARAETATDIGGGIEHVTDQLVHVFGLAKAKQSELNALFDLATTRDELGRESARAELASSHGMHDAIESLLAHTGTPAVLEALAIAAGDASTEVFERTISQLIVQTGAPTLGFGGMADVFAASFQHTEDLLGVLRSAARDASEQADRQRGDAEEKLRHDVAVIVGLVVVTALAALAISWSITRHLRPLAARAGEISQGRLDGTELREGGPREVAVVAQALHDTVANLRHVERQGDALASGDLSDPILAVPAPGPLGASIQLTVDRLAAAWREGEQLQERLAHNANHDLLTGLPNRKAAIEALDFALARANRHDETVGVLFVDLDGFKRTNDAHGHPWGDAVLKVCAERLRSRVRSGDFLARLGGDEFVVVTERVASLRAAVELGEQLIAVVNEPIEADGVRARVGASVGIGISLDGHATALDLLRDADNAVHRAKALGGGRVEIFDDFARSELTANADLEQALRIALDRDELDLHYQPVTDTTTGRLKGFEALARWERDGVTVPPVDFIPVAEQSDLVIELGRWALRRATAQLAAWAAAGLYEDAYVAVNISGRHLLNPRFIDDVRAALDESGLDPRRLVVEITETVIVGDIVTAVGHLDAVRALGVRVALDDFGTGYTSIGQLWRLPVDILKIDRAFVNHLESGNDEVIVKLMIDVAHTLGLGLIAEGVETEEQRSALRDLDCDAIQGWLVAKAKSVKELENELENEQSVNLS
ncbi:MAG: putative bifunctional diguanylate cyclase/phosphodiesterase [Acidimicrobiia bacterium]